MGQGSSPLLNHMWIMSMLQKPWYIIGKRIKRKGGEKNKKRKRRLKKYNSKKKERARNY